MSFKKFTIIAVVLSAIIIAVSLTLCFVKTDTYGEKLRLSSPNYFVVYDGSEAGTKISSNSADYQALSSEFLKFTSVSIFSRLVFNGVLDEDVVQEQASNISAGYYTSAMKHQNTCLEACFEEKQTQIISIDGNTKVVEYYSLLFEISSSGTRNVYIYFDSDNITNHTYTGLPLVVTGNTENLLKMALRASANA